MPRVLPCLLLFAIPLFAQQAHDCAIDGSVVNATTGEPIPRAQVSAMGPGGQTATAADNEGKWHFTGLACGQTQVVATRPGFIQGSLGQPRIGAPFRPMMLASGSPYHDAKISLAPQAVVTGKVVDEQVDPMMNVTIMAMAMKVLEGRRTFQTAGSANTNDLGEYRVAGLSAGKYIVCARPNGNMVVPVNGAATGESTRVEERCYPGPIEGGAASAMDLSANAARVDFTLARVPAVTVRGNLTGGPGRGVSVSLYKPLSGTVANRAGIPANMSPDGKFEIRGVTPGSYVLSSDYWDNGKRLIARLPIQVGGADLDGITVRLEPGFSVTGTVRIESKKGATPDARQVNIVLKSSDPMAGGGQIVWSKSRDTFTYNELTPGNYRLDSLGSRQLYIKSATLSGRDISREEISIMQAAGPIDVVLSDDMGSIQGQVEDSDSKPVASWVMVLPADSQTTRLPLNIMSGADGHFTIPNLPPGDYKLYAWDDWQQVEYANPDWMQRNSSPVSVTVESGQTGQVSIRQRLVPAP